MATQFAPFRRFRLVPRRSSPLTKMAIAVVIVLSMMALFTLDGAQRSAEQRIEAVRAEAAALERENERLRQDISILGTPESVERIAQSELDMVKPGTVLFQPEE